ncbi:MAG: hypothetical protein JWM89_1815 [Acidimicrobiales bacterium]|nr:hypothetical protein [Acidimicrobiales bacterium]
MTGPGEDLIPPPSDAEDEVVGRAANPGLRPGPLASHEQGSMMGPDAEDERTPAELLAMWVALAGRNWSIDACPSPLPGLPALVRRGQSATHDERGVHGR